MWGFDSLRVHFKTKIFNGNNECEENSFNKCDSFYNLSISFIIYQNFSSDSFGSEFVEQIRIADAEDTLDNIPENTLINIEKICISSVD